MSCFTIAKGQILEALTFIGLTTQMLSMCIVFFRLDPKATTCSYWEALFSSLRFSWKIDFT